MYLSKTDIMQCIVFCQWNFKTGRLGAKHLYSDSISFGLVSSVCPYDTTGPAPCLTIMYIVIILNRQFLKSSDSLIYNNTLMHTGVLISP